MLVFDVLALVLLVLVLVGCRRYYWLRGATYRDGNVLSVQQVLAIQVLLYIGLLGVVDASLRRACGVSLLVRFALVHAPVMLWLLNGPLRHPMASRNGSGLSEGWTRSQLWKVVVRLLCPGSRMLLSEEWLQLSRQEGQHWFRQKNYIISLHPHGYLSMGAVINGLTFATGGLQNLTPSGRRYEHPVPDDEKGDGLHQQVFPYVKIRAAVASACFWFPMFSSVYGGLGCFEVSKPFMVERLRNGDTVGVMPGGAIESRYAFPEPHIVYLLHRKGFVRLALEERMHLIPMYTFGETGLLPQPRDPPQLFIKFQNLMKSVLGLSVPPAIAGYPRLGPNTTIWGVPVDLSHLWPNQVGGEVGDDAVEEAHALYVKALQHLFDTNKALVPGNFAHSKLMVI